MLFLTKRLTIRELTPNDIDGFYDLQSNKTAMDMVPDKIMTFDACQRDLNIRIRNYNSDQKEFDVWAVIDSKNNDFVGTCALVYLDDSNVEIGYRFREQYWGNGIGTEVAQGLINFVFTNRSEKRIVADVSQNNLGSTRILEKLMTKTGESFNKTDNCIDLHFELKKQNYSRS